MSENTVRQSANAAKSKIMAVLSVLNGITPEKLPNGISFTLNPFHFIMGILQPLVGYDEIVKCITDIIVYGLGVIESKAKIVLVDALKDMFSCSINPIINEELLKNGVVLNLSSIDLMNILDRSPLDNENSIKKINGSFFYSGVDDFLVPDQLVSCTDMNAVIWYVKHRSNDRTVWYGYKSQPFSHCDLSKTSKATKDDGIITMEYNEKASGVTDAYGNQMSIQVPYDDCLHVFIGNTKGCSTAPEPSAEELIEHTSDFYRLLKSFDETISVLNEEIEKATKIEEKSELQCELDLAKKVKKTIKDGTSLNEAFPGLSIEKSTNRRFFNIGGNKIYVSDYAYAHNRGDLVEENKELDNDRNVRKENFDYRDVKNNYYYRKTLFEFNADYITSVKLFDSKVIAAQITNLLTGKFLFGINLSFEEKIVQAEVEKLVTRILENESVETVNDCFFTFTNDEYSIMVDNAEKERMGIYSQGNENNGVSIDYDTIYDELDKVSSSATLSEQSSSITHALNEINRSIKPEYGGGDSDWEVSFNFLYNLFKGLSLSLVYNIISPKIYMLMAINLKVMGTNINFDIYQFITLFSSLIVKVINGIVDELMEKMKSWLLSIVKDLIARLADRLMLEQYEYYITLLMQCIRAFSIKFGGDEWNMSDAEYADIYVDENEQNNIQNKTC